MSNRNKLVVAGGGAVVILALLIWWFVRAPYSTLEAIKVAAERRDLPELNRLVDFPSLKSSVKVMVMESVEEEAGKRKAPGGGFMALLAGALASPVVDAMVTPESLALMFSGNLPKRGGASGQSASGATPKEVDITKDWDGLSRAKVTIRPRGEKVLGLSFVMHREGFSWRLVAIERSRVEQ
jgi:hypothetical protein